MVIKISMGPPKSQICIECRMQKKNCFFQPLNSFETFNYTHVALKDNFRPMIMTSIEKQKFFEATRHY